MSAKTQYFMGYKFTRGAEGTYYRCAKLKKRMHIFVWEYYNGAIPKGYEVHHKDFDKSNNDISNLELLTVAQHRKLHADVLTEEDREWRRNNLNENARPKASEWHKSEKGKTWHSEHIKQQREKGLFKRELTCTNCGKVYIGKLASVNGNSFCSNICKSQYRRKMGYDNIKKQCVVCGNIFQTNKYRPAKTCSKRCASKIKGVLNENKISEENK